MRRKSFRPSRTAPRSLREGFSLIELVVAMAVFMVIAGAGISLFTQQQINSQTLTGQVGLNLSLRNAISQIQMDVANAGSGYFQSANMPSWPVGITIVNNVVAAGNTCKTGNYTYGSNCFDQLNIIAGADPNQFPPVNATDSTGWTPAAGGSPFAHCSDTSTGVAYGQAATGFTLAQTAAEFKRGDQILFMNGTGAQISTAVLTHNAHVSGNAVRFHFNPTNPDGTNPGGPNGTADPLDITTCEGNQPCSLTNPPGPPGQIRPMVTNQFCGGDWIMKLNPIIYAVDVTTDPNNPRLTRQVGSNGNPEIVMEQITGFKVGATIWNDAGAAGAANQGGYIYDASTYCNITCTPPPALGDMAYNFTLVRSLRVSLIGRTAPDFRGTYIYRNGFDNGPYQVQGVAVVVNPRNMSMND